jgi:hypothetical protein
MKEPLAKYNKKKRKTEYEKENIDFSNIMDYHD